MKSIYNELEYPINSGIKKSIPVESVFPLAFVSAPYHREDYYGINICIAMKHNSKKDYNIFIDNFLKETTFLKEGVYAYLIGDELKIKILLLEGNGYCEKTETSCFFSYLSPDLLTDGFDRRKEYKVY